jgi:hypothetical protein
VAQRRLQRSDWHRGGLAKAMPAPDRSTSH